MVLSVFLPIIPTLSTSSATLIHIPSFNIEGISAYGSQAADSSHAGLKFLTILSIIYLTVLIAGALRLLSHVARIMAAIRKSERKDIDGHLVLSNRLLHASSFFNFIFIDLHNNREESISHILEHELVHSNENHSIDRILTELLVIICWFNPFIWLFRRSVIENHEFLADSTVVTKGINIVNYQISILNQYIESASITNQFSSHIKKRIKMLNKNYKIGSRWKIAILLPVTALAFLLISCVDQNEGTDIKNQADNPEALAEEVFFVVEEMPTFNGADPGEFRRFIAQNVKYPSEAAENGVSGKVYVKFIVNSEGKVVIPDKKMLAAAEGKPLDEVVVVSYKPASEDAEKPDEKYIKLLEEEAIRVVSSSPDWEPGKQRGKNVNVMFTFPINFVLQ